MSLPLIIEDIENRLKLSGGKIDGNLFLNGSVSKYSSGDQNYIHFLKGNVSQGYLGVNRENNPVFISADATTIYNLYGEHNKPTPTDIGALSLNGGTLNKGKSIAFQSTDTGGCAVGCDFLDKNGNRIAGFGTMTTNGAFTRGYLGMGSSPWLPENGLAFDSNNITWKNKKLYGEHNKPTYADIGAKAWEPTSFGLNSNYVGVRTSGRTADQYYEFWDSNVGWADIKAREFYAGNGVNKVYHAGNKPTPADIGAPTTTGSGASGTWGINITGNAATATSATNASKLNGLTSSAFKQTWTTSAGKEYTGWIKLIEWKMSNAGYFSPYPFFFEIYRNYNSPSPESYIISLASGWGSAELAQISGGYGDRIIEQFRISCDSSKMTYWLEMYVNPKYSTYSNICYCSVFGYNSFNGTLLTDKKQTASVTTVASIITGKGIVSPTATDYTTQKARNIAANTSLSTPANGNIFLVYT